MRIAAILAWAVCAAAGAFASYPGKIVFTSDRDGNHDIYIMEGDGSNLARLTSDAAYDDQPALSPDGKLVVFVSNRDGNNELYVVGADGKGLRRLTDTLYPELDPSFSPDGKWVIFTSMVGGDKDIWRMSVETGEAEELVAGEGDQFMARAAADGALVYVEDGGDDDVILLEDGVKRNLSRSPGIDTMASFSADGGVIYFTSNRGGNYDVFAVNRDGSGVREVIASESLEARVSASPDGQYLTIASDKDGDLEIYVVSPEGEFFEQLTENEYQDYEPFWSK
jgi:TolB protein